ncbi:MAG: N-acetylmuramoyl-L-alanine amidase [Butyricicoccus sp.]|nr:N-acetylmuramoyl-L-alanine amidase [Butyricicoccus sp.]
MPIIYLSPSTQEFNLYYDGAGSEEFYMNLIADAMEPYLTASGIEFVRNTPEMTAASSIAASNAGTFDAHVALHSNASPPSAPGSLRGTDVYYSPTSARGRYLAELVAAQLRTIYPLPDRVQIRPTTSIGEVSRTRAPAILIEFAYHDNPEDADWIRGNIDPIAQAVVRGICEYFGLPFRTPRPIQTATVDIAGGTLNLRERPSLDAPILAGLPDGTQLEILGSWNGWYIVRANGQEGYVRSEYVTLNYS